MNHSLNRLRSSGMCHWGSHWTQSQVCGGEGGIKMVGGLHRRSPPSAPPATVLQRVQHNSVRAFARRRSRRFCPCSFGPAFCTHMCLRLLTRCTRPAPTFPHCRARGPRPCAAYMSTYRGGAGGGGMGPKSLCTKNGPTRFSLLQISLFPSGLEGGGGPGGVTPLLLRCMAIQLLPPPRGGGYTNVDTDGGRKSRVIGAYFGPTCQTHVEPPCPTLPDQRAPC